MKDKKRKRKNEAEPSETVEYECVVPGCKNKHIETQINKNKRVKVERSSKTQFEELNYHLFPRKRELCEKWLLAINPDKPNSSNLIDWRVCSKHFDKSCFLVKRNKQLKQHAIPSLGLEKTSNGNPKLLSNGTDMAINLVIRTVNFMYPENNQSKDNEVAGKRIGKKSTNIVNPFLSKCSVPHCGLSLADGVELFNLPKASSSKVKFTNKEGISEVIDIRTAWTKLACILNADPLSKTSTKICSKHFLPEEITKRLTDKGFMIFKLEKYVVPSLNLPSIKKERESIEEEEKENKIQKLDYEEVLSEQNVRDQTMQESEKTVEQPNTLHQKSIKKEDCELRLLPINLENEELELFDDCVPSSLFTTSDLNSELLACNINSDINQLTQRSTAQYLVPKLELMEVYTQEEIEESKIASLDIADLCRVCTCFSIDSIIIFSEEGDRLHLQHKIQQYLNIKVDDSETDMPQGVCIFCVKKLNECEKLQEKACNADKQFRHVVEQKNAIKLQEQHIQKELLKNVTEEDIEKNNDDIVDTAEQVEESSFPTPLKTRKRKPKYQSEKSRNFLRNVAIYPDNHEYPCEICKKNLGTLEQIVTHTYKIHDKQMCPLCCEYFTNNRILLEHMAETHLKSCLFCNDRFENMEQLNSHLKNFHKNELPVYIKLAPGAYEGDCKLCGKHIYKLKHLKAHYFRDHLYYACDICFQLFKNSDEQVKHTEEVHMIPCPHCNVKNYTYHRFKRHLNKHTSQSSNRKLISKSSEQIYECKFCYKGLCTKENVKRHNFWCHSQHTCIICLATFSNAESEEHHFKTHGHICICCDLKFKTKNELDEHLLEMHPNFLPFMCNYCGDTYKTRVKLNEHVSLTHDKKENFLCDICGKNINSKGKLYYHKRSHITEFARLFECNICSKTFNFKALMKTHILTKHSGSKKYKCLDCKLGYSTAKSLNIHMLKHSSYHVRPQKIKCHLCNFRCTKQEMPYHVGISHSESSVYKCNVCNKMLVQEKDMIVHTSCHLKEELANYDKYYVKVSAYLCDKCNELFVNKNNLESHMKIHTRKNYKANKTTKKLM